MAVLELLLALIGTYLALIPGVSEKRKGIETMFDNSFEDYEIGEKWRSPRGRTITEADIVKFAAFSGDWYPLHTDAECAGKTPFRRRIAHGINPIFPLISMLFSQRF
jgi:hypothetical protein